MTTSTKGIVSVQYDPGSEMSHYDTMTIADYIKFVNEKVGDDIFDSKIEIDGKEVEWDVVANVE